MLRREHTRTVRFNECERGDERAAHAKRAQCECKLTFDESTHERYGSTSALSAKAQASERGKDVYARQQRRDKREGIEKRKQGKNRVVEERKSGRSNRSGIVTGGKGGLLHLPPLETELSPLRLKPRS